MLFLLTAPADCSCPFPPHSVFRVFQNDSHLRQLLPDFIAAPKVASAARFLTFVDKLLNITVQHLALFRTENVQDTVEPPQQFQ